MKLLMHICCAPCANMPIDALRADGIDLEKEDRRVAESMVRGAVSGVRPSRSRAGAQKTRLSVGRCQVKQGVE